MFSVISYMSFPAILIQYAFPLILCPLNDILLSWYCCAPGLPSPNLAVSFHVLLLSSGNEEVLTPTLTVLPLVIAFPWFIFKGFFFFFFHGPSSTSTISLTSSIPLSSPYTYERAQAFFPPPSCALMSNSLSPTVPIICSGLLLLCASLAS